MQLNFNNGRNHKDEEEKNALRLNRKINMQSEYSLGREIISFVWYMIWYKRSLCWQNIYCNAIRINMGTVEL